ncbi:hypothetical protein P9112_012066 [Eukaryota sp. TZLM1-RC]
MFLNTELLIHPFQEPCHLNHPYAIHVHLRDEPYLPLFSIIQSSIQSPTLLGSFDLSNLSSSSSQIHVIVVISSVIHSPSILFPTLVHTLPVFIGTTILDMNHDLHEINLYKIKKNKHSLPQLSNLLACLDQTIFDTQCFLTLGIELSSSEIPSIRNFYQKTLSYSLEYPFPRYEFSIIQSFKRNLLLVKCNSLTLNSPINSYYCLICSIYLFFKGNTLEIPCLVQNAGFSASKLPSLSIMCKKGCLTQKDNQRKEEIGQMFLIDLDIVEEYLIDYNQTEAFMTFSIISVGQKRCQLGHCQSKLIESTDPCPFSSAHINNLDIATDLSLKFPNLGLISFSTRLISTSKSSDPFIDKIFKFYNEMISIEDYSSLENSLSSLNLFLTQNPTLFNSPELLFFIPKLLNSLFHISCFDVDFDGFDLLFSRILNTILLLFELPLLKDSKALSILENFSLSPVQCRCSRLLCCEFNSSFSNFIEFFLKFDCFSLPQLICLRILIVKFLIHLPSLSSELLLNFAELMSNISKFSRSCSNSKLLKEIFSLNVALLNFFLLNSNFCKATYNSNTLLSLCFEPFLMVFLNNIPALEGKKFNAKSFLLHIDTIVSTVLIQIKNNDSNQISSCLCEFLLDKFKLVVEFLVLFDLVDVFDLFVKLFKILLLSNTNVHTDCLAVVINHVIDNISMTISDLLKQLYNFSSDSRTSFENNENFDLKSIKKLTSALYSSENDKYLELISSILQLSNLEKLAHRISPLSLYRMTVSVLVKVIQSDNDDSIFFDLLSSLLNLTHFFLSQNPDISISSCGFTPINTSCLSPSSLDQKELILTILINSVASKYSSFCLGFKYLPLDLFIQIGRLLPFFIKTFPPMSNCNCYYSCSVIFKFFLEHLVFYLAKSNAEISSQQADSLTLVYNHLMNHLSLTRGDQGHSLFNLERNLPFWYNSTLSFLLSNLSPVELDTINGNFTAINSLIEINHLPKNFSKRINSIFRMNIDISIRVFHTNSLLSSSSLEKPMGSLLWSFSFLVQSCWTLGCRKQELSKLIHVLKSFKWKKESMYALEAWLLSFGCDRNYLLELANLYKDLNLVQKRGVKFLESYQQRLGHNDDVINLLNDCLSTKEEVAIVETAVVCCVYFSEPVARTLFGIRSSFNCVCFKVYLSVKDFDEDLVKSFLVEQFPLVNGVAFELSVVKLVNIGYKLGEFSTVVIGGSSFNLLGFPFNRVFFI